MGFKIQIFGWPPDSSSVGKKKNLLLIRALLLLEAAPFAFAWSHWFWVSWIILLCVGMGSIGYISLGTTVLQLSVPQELQGRLDHISTWVSSRITGSTSGQGLT